LHDIIKKDKYENMNKKDVYVLPGTIQCAKNYGYDGLDIWTKKGKEIISDAKIFIGHSLGASFILKSNINRNCKFIFINPLLEKRCFIVHFINWLRFLIFEGFPIKKAVPVKYWWHTFRQALHLLNVDVLGQIKKIPQENIIIIRGKYDNYFCDKECVEILKANKIKFIEVEAGHDWNENIKNTVEDILKK